MDGDDVFHVMRRWACSPPLQFPETIPELEDLVRCLGSDESPVQPPELINSAEYASRRADTLLLLHDRISVNDEDETESVLLTGTGVTRYIQNLAVAMNSRQILTMLGEDLNNAMTADMIRLSWFVDSMTRRWAMRQMIALVRMVLNVWTLNDNHLVRHDGLLVRDGECPEHRQYMHEYCESIRWNALRIFESIRSSLTTRIREKLRDSQLAFYRDIYTPRVTQSTIPSDPHAAPECNINRACADSQPEIPAEPLVATQSMPGTDTPMLPATRRRKRNAKPRNNSRDKQFLKLSKQGKTNKEIAAAWNRNHPNDNVSEDIVKKAVQRIRQAPKEGDI